MKLNAFIFCAILMFLCSFTSSAQTLPIMEARKAKLFVGGQIVPPSSVKYYLGDDLTRKYKSSVAEYKAGVALTVPGCFVTVGGLLCMAAGAVCAKVDEWDFLKKYEIEVPEGLPDKLNRIGLITTCSAAAVTVTGITLICVGKGGAKRVAKQYNESHFSTPQASLNLISGPYGTGLALNF